MSFAPTSISTASAARTWAITDRFDVWYAADAIPPGTAAAIALIEHRWAIPLRDKIAAAGGFPLADEWIHPLDLVAVGVIAAEEAEAAKA
jgi:hypothetical protein